jgi:hypothetical protein
VIRISGGGGSRGPRSIKDCRAKGGGGRRRRRTGSSKGSINTMHSKVENELYRLRIEVAGGENKLLLTGQKNNWV